MTPLIGASPHLIASLLFGSHGRSGFPSPMLPPALIFATSYPHHPQNYDRAFSFGDRHPTISKIPPLVLSSLAA
jgi:hypothetical protein